MKYIYTDSQIQSAIDNSKSPEWLKSSFNQFKDKIQDPKFPCFYAPTTMKEGNILFAYAENTNRPEQIIKVGLAIQDYLNYIETLAAETKHKTVLAILIKPEKTQNNKHDDKYYIEQSFELMRELRKNDLSEWPKDIPQNIDDPYWSYCLYKTPLFVNISTPGNIKRKSRNLGDGVAIVMQPRESFDEFFALTLKNKSAPKAIEIKIKQSIRDRVTVYDSMESYPFFITYGEGKIGYEKLQYGIPESNAEQCPFRWSSSKNS